MTDSSSSGPGPVKGSGPVRSPGPVAVAAAVADRHRQLASALSALDDRALAADSALPGWSRLTVVCHLRYGAEANLRLTDDIVAGRSSSYYPRGRAAERQATLTPRPGESPAAVVASLVETDAALDRRWADLAPADWDRRLTEPVDNLDLGSIPLSVLATLRLTEAEVHGTDLAIGMADWSSTFVAVALPQRLRWLPDRRSNHRAVDESIDGSWLLRSTDGPSFLIAAVADRVDVQTLAQDLRRGTDVEADAVLTGPARDLLGFVLGRTDLGQLAVDGDRGLAARFLAAFPSP